MNEVYLGLGTNLGNRRDNLDQAVSFIRENIGPVEKLSHVYSSSSWGFASTNIFYNRCLKIYTLQSAPELLNSLLEAEQVMGRKRNPGGYSDRIIDMDILFYADKVIECDELIIPHPRIAERKFVLLPMVELAPSFIHPLNGKTMTKLLEDCRDDSEVVIVTV